MSRKRAKRVKGTSGTKRRRTPLLVRQFRFLFIGITAYYVSLTLCLAVMSVVTPPTTAIQLQRRLEAWIGGDQNYRKQYMPVGADAVPVHVAHAVIAAEDGRFYEHNGVDWEAIAKALEENAQRKRPRGGSTITQQLAKNLFLTSHSTLWRKAVELPAAYLIDLLLSKDRILHLYINVIEWGPGIFGIEAAARHHFGIPADRLSRSQAARLAACIPAPRARTPQQMNRLSGSILRRMAQHEW